MRVGLVLGGGGAVGLAYHAGALAAVEHELRWDPRRADVVVGTSAGSLVATLLRRGVSAADLAAVAVEARPLSMTADMERSLRARPAFDGVAMHRWLLRRPRLPDWRLIRRVVMRPWTFDPVHAFASLVPDGLIDITGGSTTRFDELLGAEWPERDLYVTAVRQHDLRRVVMGRDHHPPVWQAAAASCAVPGLFRPIVVDGTAYVDGGVRSATNADVLVGRPLDLVLIVSPMSAQRTGRWAYRSVLRRHPQAHLRREREKLEGTGVPSVAIEPGDPVVALAGLNFMSDGHVREIVQAAYLDTADLLQREPARSMLAPLRRHGRERHRRDDHTVSHLVAP